MGTTVLAAIAALALPLLVIVPVAPAAAAAAADPALSITETRTNDLVDPLGIDGTKTPILSWKSASTGRGVTQEAYQIRAAASEDTLPAAGLWDSGKVTSDQQLNIAYGGPALTSQTRYFWQVKVWDNHGNESAWSAPSWFETALLRTDEWKGDWIGGADPNAVLDKWSDYTVDVDFTLTPGRAFGVYLRATSDTNNGYMWQLNDQNPGEPRLRPHVKVNGIWHTLPEVDLTTKGLAADVLKHRGTLSINLQGSTITTTVNGVEVSSVTDTTYTKGFVGPRTDVSTHEEVMIHSMSVKTATETLYQSDFEHGVNPFKGGTTIVDGPDGGLLVKDQVNAVWTPAMNLPLLRKDFATTSRKQVASARVYASAKGLYQLSLNGSRVGDQELAPGDTDYTQRIQYQTYDVTKQVKAGDNAIGAWLGTGWYSGHIAWFGDKKFGDRNSVIAQLVITYTDGSTQTVKTDDSWKTAPGPLVSADLLMGEDYDANFEQPGWDKAGFDASAWAPVWQDTSDSTALLHAQTDNPVRVVQERPAKAQSEVPAGSYIYDFGQNLTGVVKVTLTGKAGQRVMLRHGEVLNKDGSFYTANLRTAKATDYYTFAADGTVTYTPRFTQHGFRYVEISGVSQAPALGDVTAEVFSSDLDQTGTFSTSDAMLNQLQSNIVWGQRGNFISIPTDTPARDERLGYSGDLNAFIGTATFNMDSLAFVQKWMKDMRDTQKRIGNGAYPESAPRGPNQACCSIGTAWSDGGIVIPWTTWERYGNNQVVSDNWESMVWYMDYLAQTFPDYVRDDGPFGDWLNLNDDTPGGVLGTAYYAYDARLMSQMAHLLGKDAEARKYADLATAVTGAFVTNFVSDDGTITGDSQTAYALSLGLDLVPKNLREAAGKKLVAKLASRDYHLSTGFVGTPWLMPALSSTGNWDVAYRLLMTKTLPSWGYEVASGATTMWERWDSIREDGSFQDPGMNSFNHYAFGAVGDWMYQNIGGITAGDPGYKTIDIAPHPGGGLTEGDATFESVYGPVSSKWALERGDFSLKTTIPTNTSATVHIPAKNAWAVTESGKSLADAPGVTFVSSDGTDVVVTVGSGNYDFDVDALAGAIGDVIDASIAASDHVGELLGGGDLTAPQASHLTGSLQDVTDSAIAAIAAIDTDRTKAIGQITDALATVRGLATWLDAQQLNGHAKSTLNERITDLESQLSAIATTLSGLSVTLDLGDTTTYLPGQSISLAATMKNSADTPLSELSARFAGDSSWNAEPASLPTVKKLEAGKTASGTFTVTIPTTQLPGDISLPVAVAYDYKGTALTAIATAKATVTSGVAITSVTADPAAILPTSKTTVTVSAVNAGTAPISGHVAVKTPDGWADPLPSATVVVQPGAGVSVPVELFVPTTLSEEELALPVEFVRDGVPLAEGTANLAADVATPPTDTQIYDHVDAGDGTSEVAHNLTASATSSTSVEAGLTRRYAGSAPGSYFAFDMAVPKDQPFLITAIDTFDGPRLKDYSVIVNGVVVQARLFQRVPTAPGTGAYQILVDDPAAFSSTGTVNVMFKHANSSNYDPSIADVWTSGAPADTLAPSVSATLTPAVPNGKAGWYTSDVSATLASVDDGAGPVSVEYRVDGAVVWSAWSALSDAIVVTGDGTHTLEYRATDAAGNVSQAQSTPFKIDGAAPKTTATVTTSDEAAGANTATVEFAASDKHSGVVSTQYAVDGGDWADYADGAVTVSGAGDHAVTYRSMDAAGNLEVTRKLAVPIEDGIAPVVAITLPVANAAGWLGADAKATLSATDVSGSIQSIEYRLGDGSWQTYSEPAALDDGRYSIAFRATDDAGNVSQVQKQRVAVDGTAPAAWAWLASDGHVVSSTSDAASGIDRTEYSTDGTHWVSGIDALLKQSAMPATVWVRALDKAGNRSEVLHLKKQADASALTVRPGQALHIEASGFTSGDAVRVELHSDPVVLGSVTASALGAIALDAAIPHSVETGDHTLVFLVDAASQPGDGSGTGSGLGAGDIPVSVIADTGSDAAPLTGLALVLLLAGLGVVVARRRQAVKRMNRS